MELMLYYQPYTTNKQKTPSLTYFLEKKKLSPKMTITVIQTYHILSALPLTFFHNKQGWKGSTSLLICTKM